MGRTISIRFEAPVRYLDDGQLPVEIWVVRTSDDGTVTERHCATATKRHRIEHHVRRWASGLPMNGHKRVEVRTPKARMEVDRG